MNILFLSWIMAFMTPMQLKVEVQNISNSKGYVLIGIYNSPKGFREPDKAVAHAKVTAKSGTLTVEIPNLPPGKYAAAIIHDANGNGKLDTNFLGIPSEAYGFSNNARGNFGPPDFQDCLFEVKDNATITVRLK